MSIFILALNAITALPKILGFAEQAIGGVRAWLREQDRKKELARTQASDVEVAAAIAKAKEGVQNLNNLWGD